MQLIAYLIALPLRAAIAVGLLDQKLVEEFLYRRA